LSLVLSAQTLVKQTAAKQFRVTERDMRQIEEEGLEGEWPPL
jgi:hypothetical protein